MLTLRALKIKVLQQSVNKAKLLFVNLPGALYCKHPLCPVLCCAESIKVFCNDVRNERGIKLIICRYTKGRANKYLQYVQAIHN